MYLNNKVKRKGIWYNMDDYKYLWYVGGAGPKNPIKASSYYEGILPRRHIIGGRILKC